MRVAGPGEPLTCSSELPAARRAPVQRTEPSEQPEQRPGEQDVTWRPEDVTCDNIEASDQGDHSDVTRMLPAEGGAEGGSPRQRTPP